MALHLSTPVSVLAGLGEKAIKDLRNLDIVSIRDLLWHLPYRYDDFSRIKPIGELQAGDRVTVDGVIEQIETRPAGRNRRLKLTEAIVADDSGSIKAIWFNQPYLERTLKPGTAVSLAGGVDAKFGLSLTNPVHEPRGARVHTGRIVPVYGLTGSLTMRRLRNAITQALRASEEIEEWLPADIVAAESFPSLPDALANIHFPVDRAHLDAAVDRLKFDELFLHQLLYHEVKQDIKKKPGVVVPVDEPALKRFVASLPFPLTNAQRKAAWEMVKDLSGAHPMNRLLEGDVGSGKTAVAAIALASTLEAGKAAAYLAPTEILASQQQESLNSLLSQSKVGLLTASRARVGEEDVSRSDMLSAIEAGEVRCLVGTHALLQQGVLVPDLAFVVIDEQHRFGVEQRHALLEREPAPHLLSMTATPIPRSLALTLYGDLELSILNEMPKGRKPIGTKLVTEHERAGLWEHVRNEVKAGHQAYVVCPLIDPSDALGTKSVKEVAADLVVRDLKGLNIKVLHGKMKPKEKQETVQAFVEGNVDVLVSTTVVEVGVNVPNATVMIIMGAERFGLAQLHQLRGRVGRSDTQSYCYVLPDALTPHASDRLNAFVQTNNGFELAEYDLKVRGPGNMFGTAQSGFPDFKLATLADVPLMKKARDWADEFAKEEPFLASHPQLKARVQERLDQVHLE